MNLRTWARENFDDLELLRISTDQYAPGTIIDKDDFEVHTTAEEVLNGMDVDLSTVHKPALLVAKQFEQKVSKGLSIGVLNLAAINLTSNKNVTVTISADDVVQHRFSNLSRIRLRALLRSLQQSDPQLFKQIDEKLAIIETFAARKLSIVFKSETGVIAAVEARQMLQPLENVKVNVSNTNNETLEIESPGLLPFGFRAFKL